MKFGLQLAISRHLGQVAQKTPPAVPNLLRRKDSFCNECLSLCDVVGVIDRQTTYGSPAGCCIANEQRALPLEVVRPSVGAWVEQFHSSARQVGSTGSVLSSDCNVGNTSRGSLGRCHRRVVRRQCDRHETAGMAPTRGAAGNTHTGRLLFRERNRVAAGRPSVRIVSK